MMNIPIQVLATTQIPDSALALASRTRHVDPAMPLPTPRTFDPAMAVAAAEHNKSGKASVCWRPTVRGRSICSAIARKRTRDHLKAQCLFRNADLSWLGGAAHAK